MVRVINGWINLPMGAGWSHQVRFLNPGQVSLPQSSALAQLQALGWVQEVRGAGHTICESPVS